MIYGRMEMSCLVRSVETESVTIELESVVGLPFENGVGSEWDDEMCVSGLKGNGWLEDK